MSRHPSPGSPTFRTRLRALLATSPDDGAVLLGDGPARTWGDLRADHATLDAELSAAGCAAGSRVGLVLDNSAAAIGALFTLLATGRCAVVLDPAGHPGPATLAAMVTGPPGALRPVVRPGPDPSHAPGESSVAFELSTSGTTGPPRRIPVSDAQLDAAVGPAAGPGRRRHAPSLLAAPASHVSGLWTVLGAVHAGRPLVLLPRFDAQEWSDAVHEHRVRVAFLVPTALRDLLGASVAPERLRSLELLTTGAGACPAALAAAVQDRFRVRVLPTYGATEFTGAVAGWTRELHERWWPVKAGSAGRALPGTRLQVRDRVGTPAAAGGPGLLEVAGPRTGRPGWSVTSDLARIDADGFLWIDGRADGAISRGGFTVLPEQVQAALESHPAVLEAAVTGLPDARLGEVPMAAVRCVPGVEPPADAELADHCRGLLRPWERPVRVVVVPELPRTTSSKVDRPALRRLLTLDENDRRSGLSC